MHRAIWLCWSGGAIYKLSLVSLHSKQFHVACCSWSFRLQVSFFFSFSVKRLEQSPKDSYSSFEFAYLLTVRDRHTSSQNMSRFMPREPSAWLNSTIAPIEEYVRFQWLRQAFTLLAMSSWTSRWLVLCIYPWFIIHRWLWCLHCDGKKCTPGVITFAEWWRRINYQRKQGRISVLLNFRSPKKF